MPLPLCPSSCQLQWGRDSSVAEITIIRSETRCTKSRLQWGRDSSVAEMCNALTATIDASSALMGPRLFSRGNAQTAHSPREPGCASMGPRLFSRGNAPFRRRGTWGRRNELQWGRDSSVAEMLLVDQLMDFPFAASMGPRLFSRGNHKFGYIESPGRIVAQWGRDSSVAEIRDCRGCFQRKVQL